MLLNDSQHQISSIDATYDDHRQLLAEEAINEWSLCRFRNT